MYPNTDSAAERMYMQLDSYDMREAMFENKGADKDWSTAPLGHQVFVVDREALWSLDAYLRFSESAPCWHPDSRDKFLTSLGKPRRAVNDGLHHFTATWGNA